MRRRRPGWIWGGRVMAVAVVVGLAAYLFSVGLDKASELASVLGVLVAVAALVVPYLLPQSEEDQSGLRPGQHVANVVVGGSLTQVRDAGDVRVRGPAASRPPQAATPNAGSVQEGEGGQYVSGVWVGGNLTQVDGADGDITIG